MSKVQLTVVEEPTKSTPQQSSSLQQQPQATDPEGVTTEDDRNPEFKLPKTTSLAVVLMTNVLMQVTYSFLPIPRYISLTLLDHQISFFIIVPSSSVYAERLGGGETFSGLVIGIPTVVSALTLAPLIKYDKGTNFSCILFACKPDRRS